MVKAKLRYLRISPRKVRLVADLVRGFNVEEAEAQLKSLNKKAALPMLKLLQSAIANAEHNFKFKKDNLYISELRVDEGPTLKRYLPRAFGRATLLRKKMSHIIIGLDEIEKTTSAEKKKEKKTKEDDITIVESLDQVKTTPNSENTNTDKEKSTEKDIRREGNDKNKQHLDKIKQKETGGKKKNVFRRKSA
jgi:large subunit ribosomal protein L22